MAEIPIAGATVEDVLSAWWRELLSVDRVGFDDDFFDLGGHSLIAARLFSNIEKTYGLDLGLSTIFEARTIRQLAEMIRRLGAPSQPEVKTWSALVPIQPQGSKAPLFVISGLGGNVLNFARLASYLGSEQPVYALQPQGLDGHQPFLTRVEDMAAAYIEEVRQTQPEGPYRLVGYSFGGYVAFEMAQQLVSQGDKVGLAGLLDTPEWHYLEQIKTALTLRQRFALYRARVSHAFFEEGGRVYLKRRLTAQSSQVVYAVFKKFGRPVPQNVGTIEDINAFAAAAYEPRAYPGVLTIFRSTKRDILDGNDELLGWEGFATGGIEVHNVPGDHHDVTREPNVKVLAERLRQCLDRECMEAAAPPKFAPPKSPLNHAPSLASPNLRGKAGNS